MNFKIHIYALFLLIIISVKLVGLPLFYASSSEFIAKELCMQKNIENNCCKGRCILKLGEQKDSKSIHLDFELDKEVIVSPFSIDVSHPLVNNKVHFPHNLQGISQTNFHPESPPPKV